MELVEVYQIIYYGPDDNLRGLIASTDEKNGAQYLFKDMDLDTSNVIKTMVDFITAEKYKDADSQLDLSSLPLVTSGDSIMLNGPAKASIHAGRSFGLSFYLFGIVHKRVSFPEYPSYEPEMRSFPLRKHISGDDGRRYLTVLYAIFEDAVEAHVKVRLTNVKYAFDLYGMIVARTSAIEDAAYSSIIFFKDERDEKIIRVEPEEELILQLSRPFVALPLGSQLILQFGLCIDDNEEMSDTLIFDANGEVTNSRYDIFTSKGVIEVEVSWRWKENMREYESPDDFS